MAGAALLAWRNWEDIASGAKAVQDWYYTSSQNINPGDSSGTPDNSSGTPGTPTPEHTSGRITGQNITPVTSGTLQRQTPGQQPRLNQDLANKRVQLNKAIDAEAQLKKANALDAQIGISDTNALQTNTGQYNTLGTPPTPDNSSSTNAGQTNAVQLATQPTPGKTSVVDKSVYTNTDGDNAAKATNGTSDTNAGQTNAVQIITLATQPTPGNTSVVDESVYMNTDGGNAADNLEDGDDTTDQGVANGDVEELQKEVNELTAQVNQVTQAKIQDVEYEKTENILKQKTEQMKTEQAQFCKTVSAFRTAMIDHVTNHGSTRNTNGYTSSYTYVSDAFTIYNNGRYAGIIAFHTIISGDVTMDSVRSYGLIPATEVEYAAIPAQLKAIQKKAQKYNVTLENDWWKCNTIGERVYNAASEVGSKLLNAVKLW